jgi:hypothetical protein
MRGQAPVLDDGLFCRAASVLFYGLVFREQEGSMSSFLHVRESLRLEDFSLCVIETTAGNKLIVMHQ